MLRNKTAIFFVAKNNPGGAERRFHYMYEEWRKKSNKIFLITNSELLFNLKDANAVSDRNLFQSNLVGKGKLANVLLFFLFNVRVLLFIKKENIRKIHFCVNPSVYSYFFILFRKILNIDVSVSVVNSVYRRKNDFSLINRFFWLSTFRSARWIDFLSLSILNNMKLIYGDVLLSKKYSISVGSFSRSADRQFLQKSEKKIEYDFVFVSRLIENKGLDILLDALNLLEKSGFSCRGAILGDGPLYQQALDRVAHFEFVNIAMPGFVSDVSDYISKSRILLSLQKYENYPSQILLEGAALHALVIATDVGDTRMLLNEENSILIKYDASELANKVIYCIEEYENLDYLPFQLHKDVRRYHTVGKFMDYFENNIDQ